MCRTSPGRRVVLRERGSLRVRQHRAPEGPGEPGPLLASSTVVRKRPYASTWRVVGEVSISDTGPMRWSWDTTVDDAVQRRPYEFRFRIPGHGLSNKVEVFVLLGE